MKKKHKSIFGKLVFSYFVFSFVALLGLIVCIVILLIQSVETDVGSTGDYPYVSFAGSGELQDYDNLIAYGGWAEVLDRDYRVTDVYGEKRIGGLSYSPEEVLHFMSMTLMGDPQEDFWVFYHAGGDHRYLIYYPYDRFHLIYDIDPNGVIFTSFNKGILLVFLLLLGLEVWGVSLFISRRITKPLTAISDGMQKVAAGADKIEIPIYEEKEFAGIQEAFLKMQHELERQKAEKEEILSRRHQMLLELSHDIKTPVATIKSYASALSENMVPEKDLQKYYSTISMKADRVNTLTMNLFTMLKMESDEYRVERERVNFSEMLRTILADIYEDITSEGYDLDVSLPEEDYFTMGDEHYLIRAVENLINNARKYNTTGNRIAVRLAAGAEAGKLLLRIADDGRAIDEETRNTMFLAFARGEKARSSDGGTGLGLAIARQIIEKHGGSLIYEYADGMNCFEMTLQCV